MLSTIVFVNCEIFKYWIEFFLLLFYISAKNSFLEPNLMRACYEISADTDVPNLFFPIRNCSFAMNCNLVIKGNYYKKKCVHMQELSIGVTFPVKSAHSESTQLFSSNGFSKSNIHFHFSSLIWPCKSDCQAIFSSQNAHIFFILYMLAIFF